jgi:hypothetical protein
VLDGDLAHTPVTDLIQALAEERATGLLTVHEPGGGSVGIWLRDGDAVLGELRDAHGTPRPDLLHRLQTAGLLEAAQVAAARDASPQPVEHLLARGLLRPRRLVPLVTELLLDAVTTAADWASGRWHLDAAAPVPGFAGMPAARLLSRAAERAGELGPPTAVTAIPRLVPFRTYAAHDLAPEAWAVLAVADGARSTGDIAATCGLTIAEAVHVVDALVGEGMLRTAPERSGPPVMLPAPRRPAPPRAPAPVDDLQVITTPEPAEIPRPDTTALLRELSGLGSVESASAPPVPPPGPLTSPPLPRFAPADPPTPTDEVARKRRLFGR